MEALVGRMFRKTLDEVREIPRAEFLFWCAVILKYGDGSGVMGK